MIKIKKVEKELRKRIRKKSKPNNLLKFPEENETSLKKLRKNTLTKMKKKET